MQSQSPSSETKQQNKKMQIWVVIKYELLVSIYLKQCKSVKYFYALSRF